MPHPDASALLHLTVRSLRLRLSRRWSLWQSARRTLSRLFDNAADLCIRIRPSGRQR